MNSKQYIVRLTLVAYAIWMVACYNMGNSNSLIFRIIDDGSLRNDGMIWQAAFSGGSIGSCLMVPDLLLFFKTKKALIIALLLGSLFYGFEFATIFFRSN